MNYRLILLTLLAAFAHPTASIAADAPSIALVDIQKIQTTAKAAVSLQKQIAAKREAFQKEFSGKEAELEKSQKSLIEQKEKLSADEFNKKRAEFEKKVSDTRALFEKRRKSLVQGSDKASRELEKGIVESAAKVAEEKGYDIVLTRESVLIAEKSLDITSDVLARLDSQLADVKLNVE